MRSAATLVVCLALSGLTFSTLAGAREPSLEELDRIEATRRMIEDRGYTWEAGVTSVSHLAPEEFSKLLGLRLPPDLQTRKREAVYRGRMIKAVRGMYFPPSFDWRDRGGVTSIKNQGGCGSCWAFCAAAALESQILISSGLEEDLSEQAVIACNSDGDDCGGGWMEAAYDLWMDSGAVREECMPYHAVDTEACIQESCEIAAILDDYYYVGDTINDIKQAILGGPVAVAMAVCGGFGSYTSGCYEDDCFDVNHAVTIVGWDDAMCGGAGAWIVKNSWGPEWGEDGYIYMKYGTCEIGYAAQALNYTPAQTVHFFHQSHTIDDAAGDGDGFVETAELIVFPVNVLNIGAETATNVGGHLKSLTPGVSVLDSVASYPDIPKGEVRQSDSPHFSFTVTPLGPACGRLRFRLTISSDQGTSEINIALQAGEVITVFGDDFETDQGWTVGDSGDDAVTGIWERADPDPTWWGSEEVQPGDDHTASAGTQCYVTEAPAGASQGTYDVDGGKTTLLSPPIDLSGKGSALLTYYRWYTSNTGSNPNDDAFEVDVSDDDGATWHDLETLEYSDRTWRRMEFYLEDYITLSDQVRLRFIAQDNGVGGSIVEAAVDDISILACAGGMPDNPPPSGVRPHDPAPVPEEIVLDVVGSGAITSGARIVFGLPSASHVTLGVYDVSGRHVAQLVGEWRSEGYHVVDWNRVGRSGSRVSPGVYFVKLDCRQGGKTAEIVIAN